MVWDKSTLGSLFNELKTPLQIIGVFALIIISEVLRAKAWQRRGGSAVFLSKQKFQTIFSNEEDESGRQ